MRANPPPTPFAASQCPRACSAALAPEPAWPGGGRLATGLLSQALPAPRLWTALRRRIRLADRIARTAWARIGRQVAGRLRPRAAGAAPAAGLEHAARLMARGEGAAALALVDRDLEIHPGRPEALVLKARLLLALHGDVFAARRCCQAVMGLRPPADAGFQEALEIFLGTAAARRRA